MTKQIKRKIPWSKFIAEGKPSAKQQINGEGVNTGGLKGKL